MGVLIVRCGSASTVTSGASRCICPRSHNHFVVHLLLFAAVVACLCTQLFFAKVPPTALASEVESLFGSFGKLAEVNLFRAWAGAKHSKVGAAGTLDACMLPNTCKLLHMMPADAASWCGSQHAALTQ
jgi:hypothetical protein